MNKRKRIAGFMLGAIATGCLVFLAVRLISRPGGGRTARVYVIGLDGATWDILDPLIEQGKLPVFKKLKENGAWSRLRTFDPTLSAVVWTSIATGKSMLKHGIVDWVFVNKRKIQVPYSSSEKRTPSIWEIMDETGRRSVVLGWFVTDPPDAVKGVMVSDSFAPALYRKFSRKEGSRDFSDTVYPRAEFKGLLEYFSRVEREGALKIPRLVREMGIPDYLLQYRERYDEDTGRVHILGAWNSFLVYNRIEDLLVDRYLEKDDYDLFLAYYRFPDVFYHFGTLFLDKEYHDRIDNVIENREPAAEDLAEFNLKMADVSLPLLKDKEVLLEKIYDRAVKENAYLIIASDHGFRLTSKGYNHYGLPSGTPPPDGILMMLGPDVKRNAEVQATVYDITPSILYLTGLPVGRDMDGRPLLEVFTSKRPVRTTVYTKMKHLPRKEDADRDRKKIEELKSLGYIK
ncbi:MAG: alkaline phosphatase family protein [Candidatus Aminicenantes bacterium]|nr:alkaline phosphatase family protein [Candidatus Aminicenantes bacterium]